MEFPRLIYRGEPDVLGSGQVGENKRVNSQDELDVHLEDGWRLTRHIPEEEAAAADEGDDAGGDAGAEAGEGAGSELEPAKPPKPPKPAKAAKKK